MMQYKDLQKVLDDVEFDREIVLNLYGKPVRRFYETKHCEICGDQILPRIFKNRDRLTYMSTAKHAEAHTCGKRPCITAYKILMFKVHREPVEVVVDDDEFIPMDEYWLSPGIARTEPKLFVPVHYLYRGH